MLCLLLRRAVLVHPAQALDLDQIDRIFQASRASDGKADPAAITPLRAADVRRVEDISDGEELRWFRLGFRLIAEARAMRVQVP